MRERAGKEILLIGNNGKNFTFNSIASAAKYLGVSSITVTDHIESGKPIKGYTVDWLFSLDSEVEDE